MIFKSTLQDVTVKSHQPLTVTNNVVLCSEAPGTL